MNNERKCGYCGFDILGCSQPVVETIEVRENTTGRIGTIDLCEEHLYLKYILKKEVIQ
jgi:hypothetical protein